MNVITKQVAILTVGLTLTSFAMAQDDVEKTPLRSSMSCQLITAYADQPISIFNLEKKSITVPVSMDPEADIDSSITIDDKFKENADHVIHSYFEASPSLKGLFSLSVSYGSKSGYNDMKNVTELSHFVMPFDTPTFAAGTANYQLVPNATWSGPILFLKINQRILPILIKNGYTGSSTLDQGSESSMKLLNTAVQKALAKKAIKKTDLVLLGTENTCFLRTE